MDECLTLMRESGSEEAFEKLYMESKKGVFSFVYSYVKNYHDAEDIVQLTYLNARRYVNGYTPGTNSVAWLLEIAKNNCLNFIKKGGREVSIDSIQEDKASYEDVYSGESEIINVIKKNLSEVDAKIVLLHLVTGLKHREIAKTIDMPLGTVLWKYNCAIKVIKAKLKEDEND